MTRCGLEPADSKGRIDRLSPSSATGPVRLEGPETMFVLFRVEQKAVQKIRTFTPDCELDAGGRTIYWLEGVAPADSIALLASLATATDEHRTTQTAQSAQASQTARDEQKNRRLTGPALAAISLHRDAAADTT